MKNLELINSFGVGVKKFDIICIGDTTLDVFLELQEAEVRCKEDNKRKCLLCISYADKVAVNRATKVPAVGNAANVAVGSTRLGLKSALYTILGQDFTGKESFKILKSEKVYKDYIKFDKNRDTNFSAVLNYRGERTILVFHEPRTYSLPKLAQTGWIYLTSLGSNHQKLHNQVLEYIKKMGSKLGFNPGTHQLKEGLKVLMPLIEKTSVLIVNREEAERLLKMQRPIKTLLKSLKNKGPEIVVITDGPKGSYSFDGKNFYFQDILKVPVIERTGCGDSYSTGFLSALSLGCGIPEAMKWGTVNAAFVIQKIGAREGLLNREKMLKVLADNPQLQTKKI